MANDDEFPDNIIPFPTDRKRLSDPEELETLAVSHQAIQDLIVTAACINLSTMREGPLGDDCVDKIKTGAFPCGGKCGCYSHMLSSMALELVFEGPREEEARKQLYQEYASLVKPPPSEADE